MIIALGVCFALVLICCFLRIDVTRAVKAKEEWRSQAIKTDIDRQSLSARVDRLHDVIRENNQNYQDLSDMLEDAELELTETQSELENSEAQLAFDTSVRAEQEKTISFWIRQFNQSVDERRAVQRERDEFEARGAALAQERNEFQARCRNIADTLGVSEEDSQKAGLLWGVVHRVKSERDAAIKELNSAVRNLVAERDEERKALERSQKAWAVFKHDLGEAIGCGFGAAQTPETLVECVKITRAESVKSAADLVDVIRERDALIARPDYTYEIIAIAEALRQGRGFTHSVRGVRDYVAPKFVGPLSPDVDLIVCALDDLKSDLVRQMAKLRDVQGERDNLRAAAIKPTRGPAEDLAPPAMRTTKKKSDKLRAAEIAKSKRQAVH